MDQLRDTLNDAVSTASDTVTSAASSVADTVSSAAAPAAASDSVHVDVESETKPAEE